MHMTRMIVVIWMVDTGSWRAHTVATAACMHCQSWTSCRRYNLVRGAQSYDLAFCIAPLWMALAYVVSSARKSIVTYTFCITSKVAFCCFVDSRLLHKR
ncbi:uncharacterized protein B0H18DRAFT_1007636 [Fomitopsis serialis]|uniref:uncharacterized protein n=1 Tax=Fomitopsis serialis TaxID=139415 RepID=UPI002007C1F6|nr:uncharacterized protein B0H18DRAFT_1007636 [Neoantrodia serialis]KAH9926033.1 hypothetical protein B0H18DRAFT_1007636 [Neoantrodia serialis]